MLQCYDEWHSFMFGFVLNLIVVTEEVAGCFLCAFTRADAFAVSSVELKQGLRQNWHLFFFFKGEGNWFNTIKNGYLGQLFQISLKQAVRNYRCTVRTAVQVVFYSKCSYRGRMTVQREGGKWNMRKIQKRSKGTKYRLPWSTLKKIMLWKQAEEDC